MNRSVRYSKIDSIDRLRNERRLLESDIANREHLLGLQCNDIKNYFSVANIVSVFMSKANSFNLLLTWTRNIFSFIRSIINDESEKRPDTPKENKKPKRKEAQKEQPSKTTKRGRPSGTGKGDSVKKESPKSKKTRKTGERKRVSDNKTL